MRKILVAVAGAAILVGVTGVAVAQSGPAGEEGGRGIFQADSNGDGFVTRAEFDAGHASRFARLDADNNGQLTREEMRAQRGRRGRGGHHGGGMHLTRADANNDGNVTREEFLARPTEMFDRLDANRDGVISAAERPQRPDRPAQGGERRRADRPNPDTDGNGVVSRAEFAAMGASMFARLDANSDGRVTQEEARAAHGERRHGRR